jgi:hypothetical protein
LASRMSICSLHVILLSKITPRYFIFIDLYVPALTLHFNSTETWLQISKNITLFAVCRIYTSRMSLAKRLRWTLGAWGVMYMCIYYDRFLDTSDWRCYATAFLSNAPETSILGNEYIEKRLLRKRNRGRIDEFPQQRDTLLNGYSTVLNG